MRLGIIVVAFVAGALASEIGASTLLGPRGQFSTLIYTLSWSPGTACYKPRQPYTRERYEWDQYQQDALAYVRCIKSAADDDAKYAVAKVYEGYDKAAKELIDEIKRNY